jgi:hypothetical protein
MGPTEHRTLFRCRRSLLNNKDYRTEYEQNQQMRIKEALYCTSAKLTLQHDI